MTIRWRDRRDVQTVAMADPMKKDEAAPGQSYQARLNWVMNIITTCFVGKSRRDTKAHSEPIAIIL